VDLVEGETSPGGEFRLSNPELETVFPRLFRLTAPIRASYNLSYRDTDEHRFRQRGEAATKMIGFAWEYSLPRNPPFALLF